jgi:hypothetical protein
MFAINAFWVKTKRHAYKKISYTGKSTCAE